MKSMAVHHDNESGIIGFVTWIAGTVMMVASNSQPSELRAWITFSLGALASIISIVINWNKFSAIIKSSVEKRKKKKHDTKR